MKIIRKIFIFLLLILFCLLNINNVYAGETVYGDEEYKNHKFSVYANYGDEYEIWGGEYTGMTYSPNQMGFKLLGKAPNGGNLHIDEEYPVYYIAVPYDSGVEIDAIALGNKGFIYNTDGIYIGNSLNIDEAYGSPDGKYVLCGFNRQGWGSGGDYGGFYLVNTDYYPDGVEPPIESDIVNVTSSNYKVYAIDEKMDYLPGVSSDGIGYHPDDYLHNDWMHYIGEYISTQTIDIPDGAQQILIHSPVEGAVNIDAIELIDGNDTVLGYLPNNYNSGNQYLPENLIGPPDNYASIIGLTDGYIAEGYVLISLSGDLMGPDGKPINTTVPFKKIKIYIEPEVNIEEMDRYKDYFTGVQKYYVHSEYNENGYIIKRTCYDYDGNILEYAVYEYDSNNYRTCKKYYDSNDVLIKQVDYNRVYISSEVIYSDEFEVIIKDTSYNNTTAQNVVVAVWTENNDKDDLIEYQAVDLIGDVWEKVIKIENHNNEIGVYNIEAYGIYQNGERYLIGTNTIEMAEDNISPVIYNINSEYMPGNDQRLYFSHSVFDYESGINRVIYDLGLRDEEEGKKEFTADKVFTDGYGKYIYISELDNKYGNYNFEAHAYDNVGNLSYMATTVQISETEAKRVGTVLNIKGLREYGIHNYSFTPEISTNGYVSAKLDGDEYIINTPIRTSSGEHKLYVKMEDELGNIIEKTYNFTINNSTEVTLEDLSKIAALYGSKISDINYKYYEDLNNDGLIDIYDLVILAKKIPDVQSQDNPTQIYDEWVYYNLDGKFVKSKIDDSELTIITNEDIRKPKIIGDWIYYTTPLNYNLSNNTYNLYKIKTDGSEKTLLSNDNCIKFIVDGEWIYYKDIDYINQQNGGYYQYGNLHKVKIDGSEKSNALIGEMRDFTVLDGWVYYTASSADEDGLYKTKTDGTEKTFLDSGMKVYITLKDNWIYGVDEYDSNKLYKIDINGLNKTKLGDQPRYFEDYFDLLGEWTFYTANNEMESYLVNNETLEYIQTYEYNPSNTLYIKGDWVYKYEYNDGKYYIYKINIHSDESFRLTKDPVYKILEVTNEHILLQLKEDSKETMKIYVQ